MLVIRMQRTGRKGHAMFRVVVQDSRRTPTSGKIVASLGSYDPHAKVIKLNTEKVQFYLDHGAQPSDRVALLLKKEGLKLPKWVTAADKKDGKLRNPDKLRRNQTPEPVAEAEPETPAEEPVAEEAPAAEEKSDETTEVEPESVKSGETAEPATVNDAPETPEKPEEQAAA